VALPRLLRALTPRARARPQELPTECVWVAAPGESRRRGASCVAYKGALWQFGGVDLEGTVYNTVHRWTPEEGFQAVEPRGEAPPARWTHTAVVHGSAMFVFGGFYGYGGAGATGRYNDLWRLDLERLAWTRVAPGAGSGPPPSVRSHHAAAVLGDRMYIFGGADERKAQAAAAADGGGGGGDWAGDLLRSLGAQPTAGGEGGGGGAPAADEYVDILHNDLFEFDFSSSRWREVAVSTLLPPPPGGITARLAAHKGLLYVLCWRALDAEEPPPYDLGPDSADGIALEMACINPLPPAAGREPPGAGRPRGEQLPAWRRVAFGGDVPPARDLFSAAAWGEQEWLVHAGRSVRGELLRDTYAFSFERRSWRRLGAPAAGGGAPSRRYSHAAVVLGDVMYVAGGSNAAQQGGAQRALSQRCAAVEQLFLARTLAPASDDYRPPIPVQPPKSGRQRAGEAGAAALRGAKWTASWAARQAGYTLVWPEPAPPKPPPPPGAAHRIVVSDVNLLVQGRRFHTHSDVLSAASERFAAILARDPASVSLEAATAPLRRAEAAARARPGCPPALLLLLHALLVCWAGLVRAALQLRAALWPRRPRRIAVRDISYDTALVMMHFIYASPNEAAPKIPPTLLADAFVAADRYGVARLRTAALRALCRQAAAQPEELARLALLAQAHGCGELWAACVRGAAGNLPAVVSSPDFERLWVGPAQHRAVAKKLTEDAAQEMAGGAPAAGGAAQRRARGSGEGVRAAPGPPPAPSPAESRPQLDSAAAWLLRPVSDIFQAGPSGAKKKKAEAGGNAARAIRR